ncbi:DUF2809 domain-containing protein [Microbacteriaceae bacterium VKM Ac-2854]|nr:DUF2809 domain-containing protein [Microbacteriaceae bacterium VKM Ac-2854]
MRRLGLALAAVVVLGLGLLLRFGLGGVLGDLAGGVLYTVLVYLLVAFVAPRLPSRRVAAIAFAWSALMELLQLFGVAAVLVSWWSPLRLITGVTFVWTDLIAYAAGACAAWVVDTVVRPRRASVPSRSGG